jgi:hypothetical protein
VGRKRAAPQRSGEAELRAHPLIEKLAEASEDDGVVELRGFIGPDDGDAVRLYTSLELTECLLVPRDAIVHVAEPKPEQANDEPTRIYVKASSELRHVTTVRADAMRLGVPPGGHVSQYWCEHLLKTCLDAAGPDFESQSNCFYYYWFCKTRERIRRAPRAPRSPA